LRGGGELPLLISVPFGIVLLGLLLPSLAVGVRRLHDTNRSGWWLLISLVPILGGIVCFVFMVLPGTRGPNKYGPDPIDPLVVAEVIT
jgi:uncharacterized membrane protein YhaH (DUF805 family)